MMRCNLCRWRMVQQTALYHAEQDLAAHSDAAAGTQDNAMLLTAAVSKNKAGSPDGACPHMHSRPKLLHACKRLLFCKA